MKTLGYDWELGHEELSIKVGAYYYGGGLYINLYHLEDGVSESFADLTVNLPYDELLAGEAYIEEFDSKNKLEFIKRHKLGKVLPEQGHSGFVTYSKVKFDLERLAQFDKEGVQEYCRLHGLKEIPAYASKKKENRER